MIALIHGDCLEKMKDIPDGSVDFILTDPPYGITACKWDNVIPFEPMWEQIWRVLKPNGACAELISIFCRKLPFYEPQMWKSKPMNTVYHVGNTPSDNYGSYKKIENHRKNTEYRYPKDIINFNIVNGQSKNKYHSTQKPVPLLEYLIKTYTKENETVLDFAMGSGSTGVACKNLNRNFIGIEIEKKYFDIANKRIQEA